MKVSRFQHQFVEYVPEQLVEGVVYISIENTAAVHSCACGCGKEVVTPISPTDWQLQFDGISISLEPSIGNWAFPCQSHYFIRNGAVRWAGKMTKEAIQYGKDRDKSAKERYIGPNEFGIEVSKSVGDKKKEITLSELMSNELTWFERIKKWLNT